MSLNIGKVSKKQCLVTREYHECTTQEDLWGKPGDPEYLDPNKQTPPPTRDINGEIIDSNPSHDPDDPPINPSGEVVGLKITPNGKDSNGMPNAVINGYGKQQSFKAVAEFAGDKSEDVTSLCNWESSNTDAVIIGNTDSTPDNAEFSSVLEDNPGVAICLLTAPSTDGYNSETLFISCHYQGYMATAPMYVQSDPGGSIAPCEYDIILLFDLGYIMKFAFYGIEAYADKLYKVAWASWYDYLKNVDLTKHRVGILASGIVTDYTIDCNIPSNTISGLEHDVRAYAFLGQETNESLKTKLEHVLTYATEKAVVPNFESPECCFAEDGSVENCQTQYKWYSIAGPGIKEATDWLIRNEPDRNKLIVHVCDLTSTSDVKKSDAEAVGGGFWEKYSTKYTQKDGVQYARDNSVKYSSITYKRIDAIKDTLFNSVDGPKLDEDLTFALRGSPGALDSSLLGLPSDICPTSVELVACAAADLYDDIYNPYLY